RCGFGAGIVVAPAAPAFGFFAFLPPPFRGVAELVLISGAGMLIAAALTLTFLPALYVQLRVKDVRPPRYGARWLSSADELVHRYRKTVLVGTAVLTIFAAAVLPRLRFDTDQLSMLDPNSEAVITFRDLARDPGNSPFEVDVLAPSLTTARSLAEQLEALPEVDHTVTLASFVPDDQVPKLELIQDIAEAHGPALERAGADNLPPPDAAAQIQALNETIVALDQAAPMLRVDPSLRGQLAQIAASDQRVAQLEAVLLPDPLARMGQMKEVLSAAPVTLTDLPEELRREWVAPNGEAKI